MFPARKRNDICSCISFYAKLGKKEVKSFFYFFFFNVDSDQLANHYSRDMIVISVQYCFPPVLQICEMIRESHISVTTTGSWRNSQLFKQTTRVSMQEFQTFPRGHQRFFRLSSKRTSSRFHQQRRRQCVALVENDVTDKYTRLFQLSSSTFQNGTMPEYNFCVAKSILELYYT